LPSCIFFERHPTFFPLAKDLFERIEKGKVEAIASTLVLTELLVPAFGTPDAASAQEGFRLLSHFPKLELIDGTAGIACQASRIRAESSLRTPDALIWQPLFFNRLAGLSRMTKP